MDFDIKELVRAATEGFDLSNFKGDLVAVKIVENEVGNMEAGAIMVQNNYYDKDGRVKEECAQSAQEFLDQEVRKRIGEGMTPKQILLPVKGAKEALIPLPYNNEAGFNQRYNADISHSAWSRWINGAENTNYDERELNAFVRTFEGYKI